MSRGYRFFLTALLILTFALGGFLIAKADTTSTGFSVGFTVPSSNNNNNNNGGGGFNNNPPPPAPPTISNVASSTDFTSATVTWNAISPGGIGSASFVYGLTNNYGSSGAVGGSYKVTVSNLISGTVYYFKITVTDGGTNATATFAGSFKTKSNDVAPPVISNVAVTPGATNASVAWQTNEDADSQTQYGFTNQYGSTALDSALVKNHALTLPSLVPNITYHYRVLSTDGSGNTAATQEAVFRTLKDSQAPPDVSKLVLTTGNIFIKVDWSNPSLQAVPDFNGVTVVRTVNKEAKSINDGTAIYSGSAETVTDKNVLLNIKYFYTIFSSDTSDNISPGVFGAATIVPPQGQEVCNNGLDDNSNGKIDCADLDCVNDDACKAPPKEICNNGLDDDSNGKIDCADSACVNNIVCKAPAQEVCNNNVDDDKDDKIDCLDSDCTGSIFCKKESFVEICDNSLDDDSNGKIDCADSACFGFVGCSGKQEKNEGSVYVPPPSTVSDSARLVPESILFFAGNNKITLAPDRGQISAVAGTSLMAAVNKKSLPFAPLSLIIKVAGGDEHTLKYDNSADAYVALFTAPAIGSHQLSVEVSYSNGQFDSAAISLQSLAFGSVAGDDGTPLAGVTMALLEANGQPFPASQFGQPNPFITNANGTYFWMVPNSEYALRLTKPGFFERFIPGLIIKNNVINQALELVKKPPALIADIDPRAPLNENIKTVVKNAAEITTANIKRGAQFIADAKQDPAVQKAASQQVAPAAVSVTAVATIPFMTVTDAIPLMRFLFLQPLMLLGIKRRAKWGQIYNTLTKLPIDLATVRLINNATGRILQSKVTDSKGRYAFVIDPGDYRIEVQKNNMQFPSALLKHFSSDGSKQDIYHGEPIAVSEAEAVITANIPLDPLGDATLPKRFYLQYLWRHIQGVLSWVGLAVTVLSLYISPRWYVWVLLGLHLSLLLLFYRLARAPKVKSWGIMYDKDTKAPLGQAVARLFSTQFNKLVGTQVTDRKGRYYFLAGESQYFVTGEHKAYQSIKSDTVDLAGTEDDVIALNLAMIKGKPSANNAPITPVTESPSPAAVETGRDLSLREAAPPHSATGEYPLPPSEKDLG